MLHLERKLVFQVYRDSILTVCRTIESLLHPSVERGAAEPHFTGDFRNTKILFGKPVLFYIREPESEFFSG
jgi:hypothetical protein